jgi:GNAT superfamily N-acetyltransferase
VTATVSALREDDRVDWEQLYRAYAEFYEVPMTAAIEARVWEWIFDEHQTFYCLVARDDEQRCIGLAHYRAMPSPLRGCDVGFLDDLFVTPRLRGSGAVDALFAALREQALLRGWPLLRWITADDNYRGRAVYDKVAQRTAWITYQMDVK